MDEHTLEMMPLYKIFGNQSSTFHFSAHTHPPTPNSSPMPPTLTFPDPSRSASLLLSYTPRNKLILVIGSNRLAATRAFAALDADATVLISSPQGLQAACEEIKYRVTSDQIGFIDLESGGQGWVEALARLNDLALVCVTDSGQFSSSFVFVCSFFNRSI